jgi:hypothetical protein
MLGRDMRDGRAVGYCVCNDLTREALADDEICLVVVRDNTRERREIEPTAELGAFDGLTTDEQFVEERPTPKKRQDGWV